MYVVRELAIHKLRSPRELPSRPEVNPLSFVEHVRSMNESLESSSAGATRQELGLEDPCLSFAESQQLSLSFTNRFVLFSARSVVTKIPDHHFLLAQNPSGLFITESWCKPDSIHDALLSYIPFIMYTDATERVRDQVEAY